MSNITAVPPPPAAPPPTPPPTPPPGEEAMDATLKLLFDAADSEKAEAEKPKPETPIGKSLAQALDEQTPEEKNGTAPPPTPPTPETKKPDAPPPPPAEKKVKVRRRGEEPAPPPPPAPAPAPTPELPPKTKTEDEVFEEGLLEEERDQLELARFAEGKDPTKYRGYAAKVSKFLKEHQAYLEKNPKAVQAGSDEAEAYETWLKTNNVALAPREAKILERELITERARQETMKQTESQMAELHDDNFRRDTEPKIKAEADAAFSKLAHEAAPQEFVKFAQEKGIEEAKKQYPTEYRITTKVLTETASDIEELRRLTTKNPRTGNPLRQYDGANPQHVRVLKFMREQCNHFKSGPPDEKPEARTERIRLLNQGGKTFLTRDEFYSLPAAQRDAHWTFSPDQIVAMAMHFAKQQVASEVKEEYAAREAEGWVRKTPAPAANGTAPTGTPPPPPPAPSPPGTRPTPIPAGNNGNADGQEVPERVLGLMMGESIG